MKQLHRVNYANLKHHKEILRQNIDSKIIEKLEADPNPSLNYRNAFKTIYHDELEKTIKYQEEKKYRQLQSPEKTQTKTIGLAISRNSSQPTLGYSFKPLQPLSSNSSYIDLSFKDYDQERRKRLDTLAQRKIDWGKSFFRSQEEYQRKREDQKRLVHSTILQQLQLKENLKNIESEMKMQESLAVRNRNQRQAERQWQRRERNRLQHLHYGEQIKKQAEVDRIRRQRQLKCESNNFYRHNPITNPIQYHIDNPYILQKYTNKVQNQENRLNYSFNK